MTPKEPLKLTTWQRTLNFVAGLSNPIVYGGAVTVTLAFYFAAIRHGDLAHLPRFFKFVSMQFTPWFMLSYHVTGRIFPDKTVRKTTNLLLPAFEGVLAVGCMAMLLTVLPEHADPYMNFGMYVAELLASVVAARLLIRRVFRF